MAFTALPDYWYCTIHGGEIHTGAITSFNMEHRCYLHPVFTEINPDRPKPPLPT